MSSYAKWSRRDLAALAFGAVGVFGALGYVGSQARATAPLTDDLAGARGGMDAEFGRRVVAAFPVGSRASTLVDELKRQGFTSTDWLTPGDRQRMAVRREADRACAPTARIRWRMDNEGRLSEVKGNFREEGC